MPILPVEQFKALYLSPEGLSSPLSTGRKVKTNFPSSNPKSPLRTLIFCSNDCDSILAIRILRLRNLSSQDLELDFDIYYISSLDDIYDFIYEQQTHIQSHPNSKLKHYTRIILMGFGAHCYIELEFYASLQNHFSSILKDDKDKEQLQFWVFDYRRPFLNLFERESENWFLIIDNEEHNFWLESKHNTEFFNQGKTPGSHLTKRRRGRDSKVQFSSSSANSGSYISMPICYLVNQIISDVGINKAIYAKKEFLTSISLFWHYSQHNIDQNDYEELLSILRRDLKNGRVFIEDEFAINTRYGILPFLQYSSLEDALKSSEHLFIRSHDETETLLENEIRMKCGVTRKEMRLHQAEFRITNKEAAIQQHLQAKYGDPVSTIDWARVIYPDLNNAVLAHIGTFILSYSSGTHYQERNNFGNCRDLQNIIETLIKIDYSCDAKVESQLLDAIFPTAQFHLIRIFSKIRHSKFEVKKCGGEIIWLCNMISTEFIINHPMQMRLIAFLCTAYKARGDQMKCSSIILSSSNPNTPEYAYLFALNPLADKENPDIWPAIIHLLGQHNILIQNKLQPNMATLHPNKLVDARNQMLDLYKQRHNPTFLTNHLKADEEVYSPPNHSSSDDNLYDEGTSKYMAKKIPNNKNVTAHQKNFNIILSSNTPLDVREENHPITSDHTSRFDIESEESNSLTDQNNEDVYLDDLDE